MLVPSDLNSEDCFDKYKLFEKLSIENWILPGVYAGVFKTIVWVCPWWSHQIMPGEYSFEIGRNILTNKLAVTCLESYYISEGLFTTRDKLDNVREVKLIVIKLEENEENMKSLREQLFPVEQQLSEVGHFILDFDLDFYSTMNPFVSLYSEAGLYDKLKDLYSISTVPHNLEYQAKLQLALRKTEERKEKLKSLKSIFDFLCEDVNQNLSLYEGPGDELLGSVEDIVTTLRKHYPRVDIDWRLVHDAGCTFDDSDLPHHISSQSEIHSLLRMTEQILDMLGHSPTIVTVSRSSCDDYCPSHQVEEIQSGLLNLLKMKYGKITENHCYMDEG